MNVRIGIPRALLYHDYFPFWTSFFQSLGAEVILSDMTNDHILRRGITTSTDETCIPVKAFMGHIDNLMHKKVDYLFIPRFVSIEPKRFLCPKFMGLPYMVKQLIPNLPPVLDIDIDLREGKDKIPPGFFRLGKMFTINPLRVRNACILANRKQELFKKKIQMGVTLESFLENNQSDDSFVEQINTNTNNNNITIALLGHSYNLYDHFLNYQIHQRLREHGAKLITNKMFGEEAYRKGLKKLEKDIFWTFGKEILRSAFYIMEKKMVHGIILVVSFFCGPDSFIMELIHKACKDKGIPCLIIVIDEHSAEGGILTRIEAFMDLLKRRMQKDEAYFPAHGDALDSPERPV